MSKDLFIEAHEELMEEYMEDHPDATWEQAYNATADAAYDRMCDNIAAIADSYRDFNRYED